jgi:hypothetical protein
VEQQEGRHLREPPLLLLLLLRKVVKWRLAEGGGVLFLEKLLFP